MGAQVVAEMTTVLSAPNQGGAKYVGRSAKSANFNFGKCFGNFSLIHFVTLTCFGPPWLTQILWVCKLDVFDVILYNITEAKL